MAAAGVNVQQEVPTADDGCKTKGKWHRVEVVKGVTNITGGYNKKPEPAASIEYGEDGSVHTFVAMDKNANWFLKGAGGAKAQKGDLQPVRILEIIRDRFNKKFHTAVAVAVPEATAAVAVAVPEEPLPEIDPMDAMEALPERKQGKGTKNAALQRSLIQALEMQTKHPCAGGNEDDVTTIYVYRKHDPSVKGHAHGGVLYLRSDCLGWLLSYAAEELSCQGVEQTRDAEQSALVPNCAAVAGLNLEWDFSQKAWHAKFVAGPHQGISRRMTVQDLDMKVWAKVREHNLVQGFLAHANASHRKAAVKDFLQLWGEAFIEDKAQEFNAIVNVNNGNRVKRGKKRAKSSAEETSDDECFNRSRGFESTAVAALISEGAASLCDL